MTKEQRTLMTDQMTALCTQWRNSGIEPSTIIAFLLKCGTDTAEMAGVDYQIALSVLDMAYGKDNMLRPEAKA